MYTLEIVSGVTLKKNLRLPQKNVYERVMSIFCSNNGATFAPNHFSIRCHTDELSKLEVGLPTLSSFVQLAWMKVYTVKKTFEVGWNLV